MITVPACIQQHLLLSVFFWIQYVVAANHKQQQDLSNSLQSNSPQEQFRSSSILTPSSQQQQQIKTKTLTRDDGMGKEGRKKASIQNQKLLKLLESLKSNNPIIQDILDTRDREETPTTHGKTSWYS
jgi:hypothetical protein